MKKEFKGKTHPFFWFSKKWFENGKKNGKSGLYMFIIWIETQMFFIKSMYFISCKKRHIWNESLFCMRCKKNIKDLSQ
jgi:hypothetical protein